LRTKSDTGLKMHIFSRPDHQYACAQTDSRMMQARNLTKLMPFPVSMIRSSEIKRSTPSGVTPHQRVPGLKVLPLKLMGKRDPGPGFVKSLYVKSISFFKIARPLLLCCRTDIAVLGHDRVVSSR